jgi:hypothetical protein
MINKSEKERIRKKRGGKSQDDPFVKRGQKAENVLNERNS